MKKKISVILFAIVLCLTTALPVLATEGDGFANEYYRVADMAYLLTEGEKQVLIEKLDEISLRQNIDVVVATTDTLEGYAVGDYAELLYEQCKFGYGDRNDGLMLLISMEDRDWYIFTCGYATTAFTAAGIEYIGNEIKPDLSDGSYADAFTGYAELCDDFITQANSGEPYDEGKLPRKPLSLIWIPVSLLIGFLIAKIVVGNMKSKLKTVHAQATADSYVKSGSMNITESRDLFLYHTVTRTERPKNNSSSGGSNGGSSHGGGGGKF